MDRRLDANEHAGDTLEEGPEAPEPLERAEYDAATLMVAYPPRIHDRNKRVVFEIACPGGRGPTGPVGFSRWSAMALPPRVDPASAAGLVEIRDGFYDYEPLGLGTTVEWHVNFADPSLFVAYGSGLLAQDELQVAEHPVLGALLEALRAEGRGDRTVDLDGTPTPVLVTGAERRVRLETDPNPAAGRPHGLYGNRFRVAPAEVVRRATIRLEPAPRTNLIAMAAPPGGFGRYRADEIETILVTAFTGFRAAVLESARVARGGEGRAMMADSADRPTVVVHTGYWGCGAFGGNRELMALLQVAAAGLAGLDRLVFHAGTGGRGPIEAALERLRGMAPLATADVIEAVARIGYVWGVSDGT